MAEGLMLAKTEKYSLDAKVDSAGFEEFHTGNQPDYRAVNTMKRHGIDISRQQSRVFKIGDFTEFDRIYVMDKLNYAEIQAVARNEDLMNKVDFIMNAVNPGSNQPVPDPYLGGLDNFELVFQLLDQATEAIAKGLISGG